MNTPPSEQTPDTPRRLRAVEVIDQLIAALARSSSEHSTVSLTRNARGDTQVAVSVRTGEGGVGTIEEAVQLARTKYDYLTGLYPYANGGEPDAKP